MRQWSEHLPEWHSLLSLPIEEYTLAAGWELTEEGDRRNLCYHFGYELIPSDKVSTTTISSPITVVTPHEEACAHCRRPLTTLFDFNLRDSRWAFLGLPGERLRIATCTGIITEFVYSEIDFQGLSSLYGAYNQHMVDSIRLPERSLVLGSQLRTPYEAVGGYQRSGLSQIGGHPAWAGPERYPPCPDCNRRMVFIGQVELCDILEGEEGILHAFLCVQCHKAAVGYQQT